jgi:glycosyltransferase involved in cell wall biosynthesis
MFFSVIVPTKNRPHLLKRALESVLAQPWTDYELIVVDDGDGSGIELANSLGQAQLTTLSSRSAGQVPARNLAIATARGAHIAWLDDDDWFAPSHLADLADILHVAPVLAYTSGWIAYEDDDGHRISTLPFTASADADSLRQNNTLLLPGLAYPRSFHQLYGLFDVSMAYYWDWDYYLRLAEHKVSFVSAAQPSVWISARGTSVSADQNAQARRNELDRLEAKHHLGKIPLKNHAGIAEEQAKNLS